METDSCEPRQGEGGCSGRGNTWGLLWLRPPRGARGRGDCPYDSLTSSLPASGSGALLLCTSFHASPYRSDNAY